MSGHFDLEKLVSEKKRLDAKRDKLRADLKKVEDEASAIHTTIETLAKVYPDLRPTLLGEGEASATQSKGNYQSGSIASSLLKAMKENEKTWWTANELQAEISQLRGEDVLMTSISPNLSKLKNNGDIVRDDLKVALSERVPPKDKAPEVDLLSGNPSEAINDSGPYQSAEPSAKGREAVPGGGP